MEQHATEVQADSALRIARRILCANAGMITSVTLLFAALILGGRIIYGTNYRATVLVSIAPRSQGATGGLGALISQLGPLASIAGAAGLGGGAERPEPLAVLQSRSLTTAYIEQNDLLKVLFAKRWDASKKEWRLSWWRKKPTLWDGNKKFNRIRDVVQDGKTGLIMISITWRDSTIAAKWANDLVRVTNDRMRMLDLGESERNITYLKDQMDRTNLVEIRTALSSLIQAEIKRQMIARGTDEFAFKVIDPAVPPQEPSSPGYALCLAFGALAGFLVAVFAVFFRGSLRDAIQSLDARV